MDINFWALGILLVFLMFGMMGIAFVLGVIRTLWH